MTPNDVPCTGLVAAQPQAHQMVGGVCRVKFAAQSPGGLGWAGAPHPHAAAPLWVLSVVLQGACVLC